MEARKGETMASDQPAVMLELKEKEENILCLLAKGYTVDDMIAELHFSESNVYTIVRQIKRHFHARTIAAVISRAIAAGIISPDGVLLRKQRGDHENTADRG